MPSKRTNDSVDRILQELSRQQTAAGVSETVTDHQVDEILRSVGISSAPLDDATVPMDSLVFAGLEDTAPVPAAPAAPAVQASRPAPAPQAEAPQPKPAPRPQQASPAPAPAPKQPASSRQATTGDTTNTSIIKGFLLKMAPEGSAAGADALNQGKNQFQKFFKESAAVIPDENGRIREPGKKKRGLFGLKHADETEEFVPINVSLGGHPQQEPEEPEEPEESEEYFPDEEPVRPAEPAHFPGSKKRGLLGSILHPTVQGTMEFDPSELMPSEQAPRDAQAAAELGGYSPPEQPAPAAPIPEPQELDTTKDVWQSKYTRPAAKPSPTDTLEMLRASIASARRGTDLSATGTIYRKKRNTVEFTPGQKLNTAPAQPPLPAGEPVGEPLPPAEETHTGFTQQLGSLTGAGPAPSDSTQQFMAAYNTVRPKAAPTAPKQAAPAQPRPAENPPAEPAAPSRDPQADTYVAGLPDTPHTAAAAALFVPDRAPDDVDRLVDSLTGKLPKIDPNARPAAPAHTGFTQQLDADAPAGPAGQQPAHTGFTQDLDTPAADRPVQDTAGFVQDIANAINTQPVSADTARFDSAAARLTTPLSEEADAEDTAPSLAGLRARLQKAAPRLDGAGEDEQPDSAARPFDTAELPPVHGHEYERAEDAPAVRSQLEQSLLYQTVACCITGAAAGVLLVLGFLDAALPAMPGPLASPSVYPTVALVLLIAACAVNWRTLLAGILGFVKRPTPDSLAILPAVAAALQCLAVLILHPDSTGTLLAGPAALVLFGSALGKRMQAATVNDNFTLVSAKVDHAVAYRLRDAGALRAAASGLAEPHPSVLVSRPTQVFRGFLANSAAHGTSDKNQQQFAWLVGGAALAAALFTMLRTKNVVSAAAALAWVTCFCAPLAGTLLSAVPERLMQRSAAQVGAVIPGWRNIRQLGRINVLQVTARDLFPAGCVSLVGIKPVKPEHIDLAIVYAASILADASPTLRDIFINMLGGNRTLLAQVEDRETVYGKGYVGWINKRRVLVGNRTLMQDYGVKIPSLEYEQHHTVNQRRVIYLAVSGKLFAMFQVAYRSDPDTAAVLEGLHRAGHSLLVDCDDFNCDARLLETAYSLPTGSVKVLSAAECEAMAPAVAWLPESDGNMLHLGSFASYVGGLEAAAGAAEGERKSAYVVSASVILGLVLSLLFTLTGGLAALPLPGLVLYQAAWCVLALIFSLIQRY